jgi:hypothetical protein
LDGAPHPACPKATGHDAIDGTEVTEVVPGFVEVEVAVPA